MLKNLEFNNKKAGFEYYFIDKFNAGLHLVGTEVKSLRENGCSFTDSYCYFVNNELFLKNLHISHYKFGDKHEEKRDRKLLLNKSELNKIHKEVKDRGISIIPTRIFINDKGLFKAEIAVSKGKKNYDKRESLKEKDIARDLSRNF